MRRTRFAWMWVCLLVAWLSGCSVWTYLSYRVFPDYPEDGTETLALSGLSAPVQAYMDELGVPHVEASNELDLVRAAGFLHGRYRFFQMDTLRRYARGRLSELVGEQQVALGSTVLIDTTMRSWGFEKASRAEAEVLDNELGQLMAAYAEGVNAALDCVEPIEYRLLGVEPEPWTVADSLAINHLVAWGITHNWQQEACRLILALAGGYERAERILPPEPWAGDVSLQPDGEPRPLLPSVAAELQEMFPPRPYGALAAARPSTRRTAAVPLPKAEGASNGWVIGGARTDSGMPIVAGDPHLPHTLPSIVFQEHLRCPGVDVIGVGIPGSPYVLMGHNRSVAWTITAAMGDVIDLYIERPDPGNAGGVMGPDGPEPMDVEHMVIRVRDGSSFREITAPLRTTRRGPVLNDMYPGLLPPDAPLVSVHGIPSEVAGTLRGIRASNRARNVAELREAMMSVSSPLCAVSAADIHGDIALFATGSVPLRGSHRGTFPAPGWVEKYRWQGWAAAADMPHASGSGRDFFVNTNNLFVHPAYSPVPFQIDSAPSYRRDRIVEMLEDTEKHDQKSISAIQGDVLLLRARRVLPTMLEDLSGLSGLPPVQERALALLADWDYRATADSAACAVFFSVYRGALVAAIRDEVHEGGLGFLVGFRYFTNGVDQWFDDPEHPVWDDRSTSETEVRRDVVREAFVRGVSWLEEKLGNDPADWRWGELHALHPTHPFGSKLGSFSLPVWEAPGASSSVWKAHFDMNNGDQPFRPAYGPVLRMIVDLGDLAHAWWVIDTGNSGWPLSPHYGDQHELWKRVEQEPMVSDWDEIRAGAVGVITMQ